MSVINFDNFFEFGNQASINRIAYTKEDAKYKLKCIKAMLDLGMEISIDYAGNICGTLKGDNAKGRTIVMGSHTDSVFDGGQFDGTVGIYMALKTVESIKGLKQKRFGNIKVVIFSCEESSRFSKANIGSQYLSGKISLEQLANLKDRDGMEFLDVLKVYKDTLFPKKGENSESEKEQDESGMDLKNIKIVDRVVSSHEALMALESHIKQSEILADSNIEIGIVDSISKSLRGRISIDGKDSIITAKVMHSCPGQSHNPMESTTREAIERGTALYSAFISNELSRTGIFGIPHINSDVKRVLDRKVQFAKDCKYFIQRKLDETTPRDEVVEQRIAKADGDFSKYDSALYWFAENFLKTIGKNHLNAEIEEHREDALKYLEGAFPFCFGINLRDQEVTCSNRSFNLDLAFYAMCLGATEEQVGSLRSLLKSKKVSTKCRYNKLEMVSNGTIKSNNGKEFVIYTPIREECCIDDIQCSSDEGYQGENLYEVLKAVNDKGIGGYMEYIMKSGGLNNPGKVFEGVCLYQESEGNLFVSEGNHRVFAYQALKAVKEFITGQEQKGISFEATLYPVTIREMGLEL